MAVRVIRTGIGSYRDVGGLDRFGFFGDEVDVHEEDLERFDRLNPVEEPTVEEPYKGVTIPDLKAEIETRNEGREDDKKIVPAEPGNRPELVAALVADDTK